MGNTYYKQLCGCEIIVALDCSGYEHVEIVYCSNHNAARAMHEAIESRQNYERMAENGFGVDWDWGHCQRYFDLIMAKERGALFLADNGEDDDV